MMRHWIPLSLAFALLLATVVHASDPDLVELSKKEKAKRAQSGTHRVFTNKDIEAFKAKNKDATSKSSTPAPVITTEEQPQTESTEETDPLADYDKEKAYWRGRYEEAKARIQKAQDEVDRLQPIVDQLKQTFIQSKDPAVLAQFQDQVDKKTAELQAAQKELAAAQQGMEDLEDEGHKAGALPGWFRDE